jgi:spoIIIJ-associated protein
MEPAVETILKELLDAIGVPYTKISRSELAGQVIFSIETEGGEHTLLGSHSDTVHALDYLVKKIAEKRTAAAAPLDGARTDEGSDRMMFLIDVNDHRARQIRDLQTKAIMMAERARSFQYDVELTPMSSYERLIIHTTLQDAPNVKTESQGEGRNRRVVIKYSA